MKKRPSHEIKTGLRWSTSMPVIQEHMKGGNLVFEKDPFALLPHGVKMPNSANEEAEIIAGQDIRVASSHFEKNRTPFRPEFRAMMEHIIGGIIDLPQNSRCLDIGSGASGEMVREFVPPRLRKSFIQTDINPAAVASNRGRMPRMKVFEADYHRLDRVDGAGEFDLITGLSTLDSTLFPEEVIEQIRGALKIGGYFVHVQDVLPSPEVVIHGLKKQWEDFSVFRANDPSLLLVAASRNNAQENNEERLKNYAKDLDHCEPTSVANTPVGVVIDVIDIFRDQLENAVSGVEGMEMVFNNWLSAYREILPKQTNPNKRPEYRHYWGNSTVNISHPAFQFKDRFGASAAVTVAKRVK